MDEPLRGVRRGRRRGRAQRGPAGRRFLAGQPARIDLRAAGTDRCGVVAGRFFRAELADELAGEPDFRRHAAAAVPLVLLRASVETAAAAPAAPGRANQVNLIGCDERFWDLGGGRPARLPGNREIALNQPLAAQLGVHVGDPVILRLPKPAAIPAESASGRKDGDRRRLAADRRGNPAGRRAGAFLAPRRSARAPQRLRCPGRPCNRASNKPGQANVLLAAGSDANVDPPAGQAEALQRLLRPTPADYGLSIERTADGGFRIASDRMILGPRRNEKYCGRLRDGRSSSPLRSGEGSGVRAGPVDSSSPHPNPLPKGEGTTRALPEGEGTAAAAMVYLANTIAVGDREIPYSTIAATDFISHALDTVNDVR